MSRLVTNPTETQSNDVYAFLQGIIRSLDNSAGLAKLQVMDKYGVLVDNLLKNPFIFSINQFKQNQEFCRGYLEDLVEIFFLQRKELIYKVFQTNTSFSRLDYVILLKENSLVNQFILNDFLEEYQALEIETILPISFHYVNPKLEKDLINVKEISLEAGTTSSASQA